MALSEARDPAPKEVAIGELVGRVSDDTVRLVRDEIRLAGAEMSQKVRAAGLGAGLFGGAGICAIYGFGVLIATAVVGLAMIVALWVATLIVALVLFALAGAAVLLGKVELSRAAPPLPTEAVRSTKEDIDQLKQGVRA